MGKIIAFAGRCRSGKSELANICQEYGYEKLYFALPLKQLCADVLDIGIDGLNEAKNNNTDIGLYIDNNICEILSDETEIPMEEVKKICFGKTINTVRELLQFVGTDLIRKYNDNWHVNKIKELIDHDKNYVFDDVRFENELNLIKELGGDCWFVIRPKIDCVSNHESETSLTWKNFGNKIIINDSTLNVLKFKWKTFFENYKESLDKREKLLNNESVVNLYGKISEPLSVLSILEISPELLEYKEKNFGKYKIDNVKQDENGLVIITYKDKSLEVVKNPINIEDLKMFL